MNMQSFEALVADNSNDEFTVGIRKLTVDDLPAGELLIEVAYSSVNYKDALACTANGKIVKAFPFVPGIDLAGVVAESRDERFPAGTEVLVTGYDMGVSHFGGYSRYARVPADWAVPLPASLSLKEAMIVGTAGFTAALSLSALQEAGVAPADGPVLVTGATGGVGSVAVALLSQLGYETVASTGKADRREYLLGLGASRVVSREEIVPAQPRALDKQLWAGAVDCVGGATLAAVLSSTRYGGSVAASGLTGGTELATTVFPFILRGVRLIGIDSVYAPMAKRVAVWSRLASEWKLPALDRLHTEITLQQVPEVVPTILEGRSQGRIVVKL